MVLPPVKDSSLSTDVSVERSVLVIAVLFWVRINQDSGGPLSGSICHLEHI